MLPKPALIVVDPAPTDVEHAGLQAIIRSWSGRRADGGGFVSKDIIGSDAILPLLKSVMLLEIDRSDPAAPDYVYRIYGQEIAQRYGKDMTGKRTSDFPGGVSAFFMDCYGMAETEAAPIYTEHAPPKPVNVRKWSRLILPLGERRLEWMLVVNVPGAQRRKGLETQAAAAA